MKGKGNGSPEQCVRNLLAIVRGEVPYERIKGLDARILDKPAIQAENEIKEDAQWTIQTYEPRVTVNKIALVPGEGSGAVVAADILA